MKSLARNIATLIEKQEKAHDVRLLPADRTVCIQSVERFVDRFVDKFVAGAKSADGVTLVEKSCLIELEYELIDAWAYLQAHKSKLTMI